MERSVAIANAFLALPTARGRLTQMQLQKLTFIANGWNWAVNGEQLVSDEAEAWNYGPVYPDLYDHTKFFGSAPIDRLITPDDDEAVRFFLSKKSGRPPYRAQLSTREAAVLNNVWQRYGKLSGSRLSSMTHQRGTPWEETYRNGSGKNDVIEEAKIKAHYLELARRAQQSEV